MDSRENGLSDVSESTVFGYICQRSSISGTLDQTVILHIQCAVIPLSDLVLQQEYYLYTMYTIHCFRRYEMISLSFPIP